MKFRNVLYIFLMVIFMVFAYLLIDSGFNARTKIFVNYESKNNVIYKVYLHDSEKPMGMGKKYTTDLVDKINLDFNVDSTFSSGVNGYYKYNIEGVLVAYTDDITDSLYSKKYILLGDIVNPLNSSGNFVSIEQDIDILFDKYEEDLKKIGEEYNTLVNGYFEVRFNAIESLNFNEINETKELKNQIKVIIPLTYDKFRINVIDDKKKIDSYYDFSKRQPVNFVLMILGAISLSLAISFLSLIIRDIVFSYSDGNRYNKKLKEILNKYGDIIINVKKFYNKKKYNLIYVSSFDELMDVYEKVGNPISFREIKKNKEAIFLLMEDDNAWIYRMNKENIK